MAVTPNAPPTSDRQRADPEDGDGPGTLPVSLLMFTPARGGFRLSAAHCSLVLQYLE